MLINKPIEVQALILLWAVAFYSLWNKLMSLIVSLISLVIHSFNSSSYLSSPWRLALAFLTKHEHMLTLWLLFSVGNSYFFYYALSAIADIAIYISQDSVLDISIFWWLLGGGWFLVIDVLLFWFFFRISNRNSKFTLFPLFLYPLQFLLYSPDSLLNSWPFLSNYYCYM